MDTKKDIKSREDIAIFLRAFYEKVLQNETIGITTMPNGERLMCGSGSKLT